MPCRVGGAIHSTDRRSGLTPDREGGQVLVALYADHRSDLDQKTLQAATTRTKVRLDADSTPAPLEALPADSEHIRPSSGNRLSLRLSSDAAAHVGPAAHRGLDHAATIGAFCDSNCLALASGDVVMNKFTATLGAFHTGHTHSALLTDIFSHVASPLLGSSRPLHP